MFKVAFRQMRSGVIVAAALLVVLAIVALVTGFRMDHFYDQNFKSCQAPGPFCAQFRKHFSSYYSTIQNAFMVILYVVPCLIGFLWGAPLFSSEVENQTFKFSLTQSIKRTKWFISKYIVGMAAALVFSVVMTTLLTWWFAKLDFIREDKYSVLDIRSIAPIGYAIFAFTLGVFLGLLLKKQLSTIAATLAIFVIARILVGLFVLPNLISPVRSNSPITQTSLSGIGNTVGVSYTHVLGRI